MAQILISYRRDDSKWPAQHIFEVLQRHFGPENVFIDIDNMPFGLDFREHLLRTVQRCDVMLAIVGPNWLGQRQGLRRIDEETDWVRIEVQGALDRNIPVIPVLVDQTAMPKADELPEPIRAFAFRQALSVNSGPDFKAHVNRLTRAIEQHLRRKPDASSEAPRRESPAADGKPSSGVSESTSSRADAASKPTFREVYPEVFMLFGIVGVIGGFIQMAINGMTGYNAVLVVSGLAGAAFGVATRVVRNMLKK